MTADTRDTQKKRRVQYLFAVLVVALVVVGAGQWYLLEGLTELYLGFPLWLWLQLAIISVMLVVSWYAVTLWTRVSRESSPTGGDL